LIKFAVLNHWTGAGNYQTEVRILSPNREEELVSSAPTLLELARGGFTDNVSFFVNVAFTTPGTYRLQTLSDEVMVQEVPLVVTDQANMEGARLPENISETVN